MKYRFTADPHFGHTNILKYCNRPWKNVSDMNEALIRNYNETADPDTTTFCLGDFSFCDPTPFLQRLVGNWVLIKGNHDHKNASKAGFQFVRDVYTVNIDGVSIFMSHYAHRTWNKSHHGAVHLYGHDHGSLPDWGRSTDVGVDGWAKYKPVTFEQIMHRLKDAQPIKHH